MRRIRWSHSARRDYRDVVEWQTDHGPTAAVRVVNAIEGRLASLEEMPRLGRVGRLEGTRELVIPRTPYLVIHQLEDTDNEIVIIPIVHGARRWPPSRP